MTTTYDHRNYGNWMRAVDVDILHVHLSAAPNASRGRFTLCQLMPDVIVRVYPPNALIDPPITYRCGETECTTDHGALVMCAACLIRADDLSRPPAPTAPPQIEYR